MFRETECNQKRIEFEQIRKELNSFNSYCSFLNAQDGPFSTIPLSKNVLNERSKKLKFFLREDGFINLSGTNAWLYFIFRY